MKTFNKLFVILILFTTSCQKDSLIHSPELKSTISTRLTLEDAKNHYYSIGAVNGNLKFPNSDFRISETDPSKKYRLAILPSWKNAKSSINKMYSYIEVPINTLSYLSLPVMESRRYTNAQKAEILRNTKSFLVFFRNLEGIIRERIITYIPDLTFKSSSNHRTILEMNREFTGNIEYKNIYGEKLFSIKIKNGVSVSSVSFIQSGNKKVKKSDPLKTSSLYCYEVITDWYEYGCVIYYPDGANGEEIEACGMIIPIGSTSKLECYYIDDAIDCADPINFYNGTCDYTSEESGSDATPVVNPTYPLNENAMYIQERHLLLLRLITKIE